MRRACELVCVLSAAVSGADFQINSQDTTLCLTEEYFDASTLSCVSCAPNSLKSPDGQSCICVNGYKTTYTVSGTKLVLSCVLCVGEGVTNDNGDCIPCGSALLTQGRCICASGIFTDRDERGVLLQSGTCLECAAERLEGMDGTCSACQTDLPIPDPDGATGTCGCQYKNEVNEVDVCFVSVEAQTKTASVFVNRANSAITSQVIQQNIYTAYRHCVELHSSTACNQLANFCTLQLIESSSACSLLAYIQTLQPLVEGHASWFQFTPWVVVDPSDVSTIEEDSSITTEYTFSDTLNIVSSSYDVNGTFLGYEAVETGFLQLCKFPEFHLRAAWSFAAPQTRSCTLSPSAIFALGSTKFRELFVKYENENREYLYPIVIKQACDSSCLIGSSFEYFRRFFVVDTISTIEPGTIQPTIVRYASKIHMKVKMRGRSLIYPPILELTYSDISLTDDDVVVNFEVSYANSEAVEAANEKAWTIAIGCLIPLFFIISIIPFVSWNRRNGTGLLDLTMIVKFILAVMDGVSWAFLIIVFGFSFYWFLENNGEVPTDQVVPISTKQMGLFKAFISLAFIFKALDVIHIIVRQSKLDIFFIDWEREKPLAEGDQALKKSQPSKISIWRTVFAANEWVEIQTVRKTSIVLQLFIVIFLLEVLNFDMYGCKTPVNSPAFLTNCASGEFREDSIYLRAGLGMIVYGGTWLVQYLLNRLIISHFFYNPINQFVDLLSVMNISLLTLTHRQFGYYIHGRSVHGRSDTDMLDLQQCLKREENGQTGTRGLEPGQDTQTFELSVTNEFRQRYDNFYQHLGALNRNMGNQASGDAEKGSVESYKKLNTFLQRFFMHGIPTLKYHFNDKGNFEKFLDMEFLQQINIGETCNIYRDPNGETIGNILFYGKEVNLFVLELLSFIIFDIAFSSYVVAAAITYLLSTLLSMTRLSLAKRNMSEKTLIDKRFLI